MECKTRTLISWAFIAFGIWLMLFSSIPNKMSAFAMLPFLFFRSTKADQEYYKNIGKNPGILLKLSFTWMLCWLGYILFNYYQTNPIGTFTLTNTQWLLFISPLLLIFLIYEVLWYLSCSKA